MIFIDGQIMNLTWTRTNQS